jgi:hypothetical protein
MLEPKRLLSIVGLFTVVAVAWFALTLVPVSESPRELYESAKQFEQSADRSQAIELYQKIVTNHPDSHFARSSSSRLKQLAM